jgi:aspartate aminotransferase-like enzyme
MPEPIRYFFPGPAYVRDEIRQQLTGEVVPHRSARGKEVYASVAARLKPVFRTSSEVFVATGSSTR